MKNNRTSPNFQVLLAVILLLGIQNLFAQNERYTNSVYNVAFQTPVGSVKNAMSTTERAVYDALDGKNNLKPRFEFLAVSESFATTELSREMGTDEGLEKFVAGAVEGFKAELKGAKVTVTEKKRIKLAGLNAIKFVGTAVISGIKMRFASYTVVVPKHTRMYNFNVFALENDFDEWLSICEKSVYSFALLKPSY